LLASKLQDLLRQEMQTVLVATDEIVDASIEGDYAKLETGPSRFITASFYTN